MTTHDRDKVLTAAKEAGLFAYGDPLELKIVPLYAAVEKEK